MSDNKMKCLMKETEEPGYTLKEIDVPVPQEGELLVKCLKSSICGSDINLFIWNDSELWPLFQRVVSAHKIRIFEITTEFREITFCRNFLGCSHPRASYSYIFYTNCGFVEVCDSD